MGKFECEQLGSNQVCSKQITLDFLCISKNSMNKTCGWTKLDSGKVRVFGRMELVSNLVGVEYDLEQLRAYHTQVKEGKICFSCVDMPED